MTAFWTLLAAALVVGLLAVGLWMRGMPSLARTPNRGVAPLPVPAPLPPAGPPTVAQVSGFVAAAMRDAVADQPNISWDEVATSVVWHLRDMALIDAALSDADVT